MNIFKIKLQSYFHYRKLFFSIITKIEGKHFLFMKKNKFKVEQ